MGTCLKVTETAEYLFAVKSLIPDVSSLLRISFLHINTRLRLLVAGMLKADKRIVMVVSFGLFLPRSNCNTEQQR
ncbi:hypothetical protein DPMN_122102 [Dreissena polymorpha]|uniref:Uncharacterized protein n=1 Tax=Dreissena polymorpha TaxID=45954 RepID=A0A9D4JQ79_DREPO|nr:hypothetical protein DPMN_122102 [Dreissena polymorpha]